MLLSLSRLKEIPFAVRDVSALLQRPSYRTLDHRALGRKCNGVLLVQSGKCRFSFGEAHLDAEAGDLVYLPLASRHLLTLEGDASFYRVDFYLHALDGTPLFFSETPLLLVRGASEECHSRIRLLAEQGEKSRDTLFLTEQIAFILRECEEGTKSERAARLQNAVRALHEKHADVPSISDLAALCHLSPSRFYELFKREYGKTPLAYRDTLLFERACARLTAEDMTVAELATALGFADPAYFSRFFKRHAGISPKQFLARQTKSLP